MVNTNEPIQAILLPSSLVPEVKKKETLMFEGQPNDQKEKGQTTIYKTHT